MQSELLSGMLDILNGGDIPRQLAQFFIGQKIQSFNVNKMFTSIGMIMPEDITSQTINLMRDFERMGKFPDENNSCAKMLLEIKHYIKKHKTK